MNIKNLNKPTNDLPYYLIDKLSQLNIYNLNDLKRHNYLKVYKWLQYLYPVNTKLTLYHLYCLVNDIDLINLNIQLKQQILIDLKLILPSYPPLAYNIINDHLDSAVSIANQAIRYQEIPIGAIIVYQDNIIAYGYNQTRTNCDITQHAEIVAIRYAQKKLNNYRLDTCDLYVTIEPCLMCAGAIMQSRVRRLIFGAVEPKTGAIVSQYQIFNNLTVNHHTETIGPINNIKYKQQLQYFFHLL